MCLPKKTNKLQLVIDCKKPTEYDWVSDLTDLQDWSSTLSTKNSRLTSIWTNLEKIQPQLVGTTPWICWRVSFQTWVWRFTPITSPSTSLLARGRSFRGRICTPSWGPRGPQAQSHWFCRLPSGDPSVWSRPQMSPWHFSWHRQSFSGRRWVRFTSGFFSFWNWLLAFVNGLFFLSLKQAKLSIVSCLDGVRGCRLSRF